MFFTDDSSVPYGEVLTLQASNFFGASGSAVPAWLAVEPQQAIPG
jgi:hypothetical protein